MAQPIFERGYAFYITKNYQKALNDFNKVRELNPDNGEIYYWIGEVELAKGNNRNACENFEIAKNN